jgi:threonine synthase
MQVRCTRCSYAKPFAGFPYRCPLCDGILLIHPDPERLREIDRSIRGIERYREMLPVRRDQELVTLGEGDTPLIFAPRLARELGAGRLYLKNETVNPTGSFKDRALAVMTAVALQEGYGRVISSSSGNAGVSSAAYAARAGIEATVLVPEKTRPTKIGQILVHGARVIRVRGSASDTYRLAKSAAETGEFANLTTTFLSPLATAAFATIGYELVDQLESTTPDWVVAPVSAGPILVAVAQAFQLACAAGLVGGVPGMVCAQARGCSPIVRAFEKGEEVVEPWGDEPDTIATAIADPLKGYAEDGTLTLETVRETGGIAVAVGDREISSAIRLLAATEGIFAEPAGAVPVAAAGELARSGVIGPGDRVVCLITGHGLKDPAVGAEATDLPLIEADPGALREILETRR